MNASLKPSIAVRLERRSHTGRARGSITYQRPDRSGMETAPDNRDDPMPQIWQCRRRCRERSYFDDGPGWFAMRYADLRARAMRPTLSGLVAAERAIAARQPQRVAA